MDVGAALVTHGQAAEASELRRIIGCPVLLERHAVLALTGEVMSGCARGADDVLGIFFGAGIGAAYILGGVPFRALAGLRTDSLEAYCSGRALQDLANRHGVVIGDVFPARHEATLTDELTQFVRNQAFAVGTGIALFSPYAVVLGGRMLDIQPYPRAQLLELTANHAPAIETA